jgi:DNA-binding transcriptional ArsR family regulator
MRAHLPYCGQVLDGPKALGAAATTCQAAASALTYNQMVVRCEPSQPGQVVDHLFHALADATRRDILRRGARGELSVSRLAESYPMSFAAVQKHVAVLERAGLVIKRRRGREQLVQTNADAIRQARQALDQLEAAWRGRVERMSQLLAQDADPRENDSAEGRDQ